VRITAKASLRCSPGFEGWVPSRWSAIQDYYVGLLFGALASTVCGYLWFRSRYIPRSLAVFGMIASAFCVVYSFVFYIFPNFDKIVNLWWFDTPMGIFDIALSFWLVFNLGD
jgi:hypothetical protein